MNDKFKNFFVIIFLLIVGILLGRMIINSWNENVNSKVEKELNKVVMIDIPAIDNEADAFLHKNKYKFKYLTAIDVSTGDYGIYEIRNNMPVAQAHGKCASVGDAEPGIYEIQDTKSHIDYHNVRYWRVVELKEREKGGELVVSSSGFEIDDAPRERIESDGFGNVMVDSEIMLTVYDNSEPGIVLIVIDSGANKNEEED